MLAVKSNYAAERQQSPHQRRQPSIQTSNRSNRAALLDKVSLVSCIAVVAAVFWVLAGNSGKIEVMNHSVATLQAQVTQVSAQNAALTTKVDELKRPSRILSIALNQYHMKYATPVKIPATPSASK